jgi:hypothetical protein
VSEQLIFRTAAAQVQRISTGEGPAPAPTTTGSAPVATDVPPTTGGEAAVAQELVEGRA